MNEVVQSSQGEEKEILPMQIMFKPLLSPWPFVNVVIALAEQAVSANFSKAFGIAAWNICRPCSTICLEKEQSKLWSCQNSMEPNLAKARAEAGGFLTLTCSFSS